MHVRRELNYKVNRLDIPNYNEKKQESFNPTLKSIMKSWITFIVIFESDCISVNEPGQLDWIYD